METTPPAGDPTPRDGRRSGVPSWLLPGAIVLFVYLATFLILPRNGFWINDNGCKFIQLQGIINTHYRDFSMAWPGQDLDPSFSYNPIPRPFGHVVDGRLYGTFSPVFALFSSLPYRAAGFSGLYVLPLLGGLLTLPAVWKLTGAILGSTSVRRFAQPLALTIVALGTPMWFYSTTFWEHVPAVCLAMWSLVCFVCFLRHGSMYMLAWSAALCGIAVYFRDELYVLGVVLAVASICSGRWKWRVLAAFAGMFIITVAPLWAFQWIVLGHPLGYHFAAGSVFEVGLRRHLLDRGAVVESLFLNAHRNSWLSMAIAGPYLVLWLAHPRVSRGLFGWVVVSLAGIASAGSLVSMAGFLTSDSPIWWLRDANGLFGTSPILILALVRGRTDDANREEASPVVGRERLRRALLVIMLLWTALYALLTPKGHAGGIHWGCRYLLPVYPVLGVLASVTIAEWWVTFRGRSRTPSSVSYAAVALTLALALTLAAQMYSLTLLHSRKQFCAKLNRVVAERPERVVIADNWFMPQELARCFFDKEIFLVRGPQHGDELVRILRDAGVRDALFVGWPPAPDALAAGAEILNDGRLNFISVEVRPVHLGD